MTRDTPFFKITLMKNVDPRTRSLCFTFLLLSSSVLVSTLILVFGQEPCLCQAWIRDAHGAAMTLLPWLFLPLLLFCLPACLFVEHLESKEVRGQLVKAICMGSVTVFTQEALPGRCLAQQRWATADSP